MNQHTIVELHGDGISAELSESVHTISEALGGKLRFEAIDLSQENRDAEGDSLYEHAVQQMGYHKVALKYPTATTGVSPNKVLRERCQFSVIHRPVCSIPGIETNFTEQLNIDVIRVATGGTYDDAGRYSPSWKVRFPSQCSTWPVHEPRKDLPLRKRPSRFGQACPKTASGSASSPLGSTSW